MGAISFFEIGEGIDAFDAFSKRCADAEEQFGKSEYSGTIATTVLVDGVKKLADVYSPEIEDYAYEYADSQGFGSKWESRCLDLGVCEYRVTTVNKPRIKKETLKYETRFVVSYALPPNVSGHVNTKPLEIKIVETKAEAEEIARNYALVNAVNVVVKKQKVPVSGTEEVSRFECTTKVYKSKPKRIPKDAHMTEIHMYAFYGFAGC